MVAQAVYSQSKLKKQQGFTLVEVMISIVVAMVVLAGLMLTFTNQSNQYQYQNKRIDASQDLEFAIKFVARDLRSALVGLTAVAVNGAAVAAPSSIVITSAGAAPFATTTLIFEAWDGASAAATGRVTRYYSYAGNSLAYDRDVSTSSPSAAEVLPNVTLFKVFDDSVTSRAGYAGIPAAQPNILIPDPANPSTPLSVPGYTILIEVEVSAGYKGGGMVNVIGVPTTTKRIWRYAQVYPMAAVQ